MSTIATMPPRVWKPTAEELRAIRAYCAETEGKRPGAIVIEIGNRYNIERGGEIESLNIYRVTDLPDWCDTDINGTAPWRALKAGIELDKRGRALLDFYIYEKAARDYHGELLGNAQAYVETRGGAPRLVGFSATERAFAPYRPEGTPA